MESGLQPTHRAMLSLGQLQCGYYYTGIIAKSVLAKKGNATTPSVQRLSKRRSDSKQEKVFPCLYATTNCPTLRFFTAVRSAQIAAQVVIAS